MYRGIEGWNNCPGSHSSWKSLHLNSGSLDSDSGLLTTTCISTGPPLQLLLLLLLLTILSFLPTESWVGHTLLTAASLQALSWPGLPLTSNRGNTFLQPEPGVGISIVELLASGDRVLSVLPHDLVAKGWVQVQAWLFLETLLLFLYFAEFVSSAILYSEGDFGSSAQTIRHVCGHWSLPWRSEHRERVTYIRVTILSFTKTPVIARCFISSGWSLGGGSQTIFILFAHLS